VKVSTHNGSGQPEALEKPTHHLKGDKVSEQVDRVYKKIIKA
jgi:hypothetical protein